MDELAAYDYVLPNELIARHPPAHREEARLLVVDRQTGSLRHAGIRDLPKLLRAGDCLVLNDTRVLPARLLGSRLATGARWEGLYLSSASGGGWNILGKTRGKLVPGERIRLRPAGAHFSSEPHPDDSFLDLILVEKSDDGIWLVQPDSKLQTLAVLHQFGTVPLPPYMERDVAEVEDIERYQTTYAQNPGSVAAPTAGLHFTPELLAACQERGIDQTFVTLHVGIGTFRPVTAERLSDHQMHSEWCEISEETVAKLQRTRERGGRIVAVGTTSARTLESASTNGSLQPYRGETRLFIRPPYRFNAVDVLLTNFHLPKSTLLVLVSALAGRELILRAYETAIREKYRFFSYGDAMLLV